MEDAAGAEAPVAQLEQELLIEINRDKVEALLFLRASFEHAFSHEFRARIVQHLEYLCVEKILCARRRRRR